MKKLVNTAFFILMAIGAPLGAMQSDSPEVQERHEKITLENKKRNARDMARKSINLYAALNLQHNASAQEIRNKYLEKVQTCHPDKVPGKQQEFAQVTNAYAILSDSDLKKEYDKIWSARQGKTFRILNWLSGKKNQRRENARAQAQEQRRSLYERLRQARQFAASQALRIASNKYVIATASAAASAAYALLNFTIINCAAIANDPSAPGYAACMGLQIP